MSEMRKFAFVTNIIETRDVQLRGFYPILGKLIPLPVWNLAFRCIPTNGSFGFLRKRGWLTVAEYDILNTVKGYTILVLLTAKQIVKNPLYARHRILDACLFAQDELGVDVIGLGSLSKSITNEGLWLKKSVKVAVTHGDTYSVAITAEGIEKIAKLEELRPFTLGIAGAYGKIGEAVAKIFCKKGVKLVLMGRKKHLLEKMIKTEPFSQSRNVKITTNLQEMLDTSDIALMATSAPYSLISPEYLRRDKSYFIYDVGQPYNLDKEQYAEILRRGFKLKRYDGAIVEPPDGVDIGFDMRLKWGREYACFAETVLQTISGDTRDHIGEIDLKHVNATRKWGNACGFHHAPFECFLQPIKSFGKVPIPKKRPFTRNRKLTVVTNTK